MFASPFSAGNQCLVACSDQILKIFFFFLLLTLKLFFFKNEKISLLHLLHSSQYCLVMIGTFISLINDMAETALISLLFLKEDATTTDTGQINMADERW